MNMLSLDSLCTDTSNSILVTWYLLPGACYMRLLTWYWFTLFCNNCLLIYVTQDLIQNTCYLIPSTSHLFPETWYLILVTWYYVPTNFYMKLVTWCLFLHTYLLSDERHSILVTKLYCLPGNCYFYLEMLLYISCMWKEQKGFK